MPTGLTSDIYEGKDMSLRKFALKCFTQFGGGYQASDGGSKPLPLYDAPVIPLCSYHTDRLKEAKENMKHWLEVENDSEVAKKLYDEYVAKHEEDKSRYEIKVNTEMRNRYLQMIEKVEAWALPETYKNIKELMLKQLNDSMEFDCPEKDKNPYDYEVPSMEDWLKLQIEMAARDIEYHSKELKEEIKRNKEINEYIKGFYEELNNVEPITL